MPIDMQVLDSFIDDQLRNEILEELDYTYWRSSKVVTAFEGPHGVEAVVPSIRKSESSDERWFSSALLKKLRKTEKRVAELIKKKVQCFEPWQATRYGRGDTFGNHMDTGNFAKQASGAREWTVILYLQQPVRGGSTCFPNLGTTIKPSPGRLVVWKNTTDGGLPNYDATHRAMPVTRGKKTVLITWVRQHLVK